MVHQHFMLGEPFSGLENLLLFNPNIIQAKSALFAWLPWFKAIPRRSAAQVYDDLGAETGLSVDLERSVSDLSVGEQQRLELLKILHQGADIIIFDEPTAVLTPQEVDLFFAQVRALRAKGKTIVLISHKLNEIAEITDNVTVIRQGSSIGTWATATTSRVELAELMVGNNQIPQVVRSPLTPGAKPRLAVTGVRTQATPSQLHGANLVVHGGEVVGIAGVEGNGQDAMIRAILAPHSLDDLSGSIEVDGRPIIGLAADEIRQMGVVGLPEDRLRYGILPGLPLYQNLLLGQHRRSEFHSGPIYNFKKVRQRCAALVDEFDVRPRDVEISLDRLSGGNQQKFVVARELSQKPGVMVAAHPTRGVDILAKAQIHNELLALGKRGAAVLVISSDLEELFELCHRILVICKGQIVKEMTSDAFDLKAIGSAMGGIQ
jgi:simple sugar transport system ATP-binding protein